MMHLNMSKGIKSTVFEEQVQGPVSFRSENRQIQAGFKDHSAQWHLETILVKVQI